MLFWLFEFCFVNKIGNFAEGLLTTILPESSCNTIKIYTYMVGSFQFWFQNKIPPIMISTVGKNLSKVVLVQCVLLSCTYTIAIIEPSSMPSSTSTSESQGLFMYRISWALWATFFWIIHAYLKKVFVQNFCKSQYTSTSRKLKSFSEPIQRKIKFIFSFEVLYL